MARYDLDYGREYGPGAGRTSRPDFGRAGRERVYGREGRTGRPGKFGYGREYLGYEPRFEKSRRETDYGDPFHDRERHTPIRLMHGEFEEYGREFRGRRRGGGGYGSEFRHWRY